MGRSGLGSLDIYTESSIPPAVWARVYDDKGAQGTLGFIEKFMRPAEALQFLASATMTVPDPAIYRSNVGVRSLADGARVSYSLYDRDGRNLKQVVREYGSNTFTQVLVALLFDLPSVPAGRFTLRMQSGSAFLYLSTTDNRTNDSAIELAQVH